MKYLIFFFLTVYTNVNGQDLYDVNIKGCVVTKHSKSIISNAGILFYKNNGTPTDSLGYFEIFNIKDSVLKLRFSAVGYDDSDTVLYFSKNGEYLLYWEIDVLCNEIHEGQAKNHLKDNKVMFLLQGGSSPNVYKSQRRLTKKYGIRFYEFGCNMVDHFDCLSEYNKTIATYLDNKYGLRWRKGLDARIIGVTTK